MDSHEQQHDRAQAALDCPECRLALQDYLDGTLEKKRSLSVFLHLRTCAACRVEHEALQDVFARLDGLPALEAPADFDAVVLASVPYAAYRAMEPLRRVRVPVFLEDGFLPVWLRSPVTRAVGGVAAVAAVAASLAAAGPGWLALVPVIGLLPEALVRLQQVGRRLVGERRAEG